MEDILASIRRIISDDDHEPPRRAPLTRPEAAPRERAAGLFEPARTEPARSEAARPTLRPDLSRSEALRPEPARPDVARAAAPAVSAPPVAMPRAEPPVLQRPRDFVLRDADAGRPADTRRAVPQIETPRADMAPREHLAPRAELRRPEPVRAPEPAVPERWHDEPSVTDFDFEAGIEEALTQLESIPAAPRPAAPPLRAPEPVRPPEFVRTPEPVRTPEAPRAAAPEPAPAPVWRDLPEVRPVRVEIPAPPRRKDLLSPSVDAAVAAAFGSLGSAQLPEQGRTVEDLMKEILRPMLKDWLDENLPDIVEGLVRAEIERAARGGR